MFIDYLERYAASLPDSELRTPETVAALAAIAQDRTARDRYLEFARDADELAVEVRMMELAQKLGWLTPEETEAEFIGMIAGRMAREAIGSAEVDLVCGRAVSAAAGSAAKGLPAAATRRGSI